MSEQNRNGSLATHSDGNGGEPNDTDVARSAGPGVPNQGDSTVNLKTSETPSPPFRGLTSDRSNTTPATDLKNADLGSLNDALTHHLAAEINREHERAFGKAREALDHARRAGELLLEAKAALKHGEWLPWLKANCYFSDRTAQGYMRLASQWAVLAKSATVADLGLREALELLSPSPSSELDGFLDEMRSLGGQELADRWTGTREDAEEATRLISQRIADDCYRVANSFGVSYELTTSMFFAMLNQHLQGEK